MWPELERGALMVESARDPRVPVVVLGAGLTGLSAARHLQRAGIAHRVFERRSLAGGHAVTVEEAGFRFDRTGHLLAFARRQRPSCGTPSRSA